MKSALLGILAIVAVTGCSLTHRSGDFACTKTSDCNQGRECVGGFCIIPGSIDAPTSDSTHGGSGDANNGCPSVCTSCDVGTKTCTIDCTLTDCTAAVACPAGYKCDVQCNADNSCRAGVSCTGTTSCTVECTGKNSCQDVTCGLGPCNVSCSGMQSCRTIQCGSSCMCDVECTGTQACEGTETCTSLACKSLSGCSSAGTTCHSTCP